MGNACKAAHYIVHYNSVNLPRKRGACITRAGVGGMVRFRILYSGAILEKVLICKSILARCDDGRAGDYRRSLLRFIAI